MSDSPQPNRTLHRKGKFDRSTSIVQAINVAVVLIVSVPPLLDPSTCESNFIITSLNCIIPCILLYVYYHTSLILSFSLLAYSLMKLCLVKVAKVDLQIGTFFTNPVTYVGGLCTIYCLLFIVRSFTFFMDYFVIAKVFWQIFTNPVT